MKIRPVKGMLNYYFSILIASFFTIIYKRIANPSDYYIGESVVRINDTKFKVNRFTSFGFYLNLDLFEPTTFGYLKNSKGEIFVDVGANAGGYSIRFASNLSKLLQ